LASLRFGSKYTPIWLEKQSSTAEGIPQSPCNLAVSLAVDFKALPSDE